eukprot:4788731-Pleurochrysis_carterae.AAC.1
MVLADHGVETKADAEEAEDCPPDIDNGANGYAAAYVQLSFAAAGEQDLCVARHARARASLICVSTSIHVLKRACARMRV